MNKNQNNDESSDFQKLRIAGTPYYVYSSPSDRAIIKELAAPNNNIRLFIDVKNNRFFAWPGVREVNHMTMFNFLNKFLLTNDGAPYREYFLLNRESIFPLRGIIMARNNSLILSDLGTIDQDYFFYSKPEQNDLTISTTGDANRRDKLKEYVRKDGEKIKRILAFFDDLNTSIIEEIIKQGF